MRMVKFTRDMAPHNKGDTRVVPDEIADSLVKEGSATYQANEFFDPPPKKKKAHYLTR